MTINSCGLLNFIFYSFKAEICFTYLKPNQKLCTCQDSAMFIELKIRISTFSQKFTCQNRYIQWAQAQKYWFGVFLLQNGPGGLLVITQHMACCSMPQIIKYSLFIINHSQFRFGKVSRATSRQMQIAPPSLRVQCGKQSTM